MGCERGVIWSERTSENLEFTSYCLIFFSSLSFSSLMRLPGISSVFVTAAFWLQDDVILFINRGSHQLQPNSRSCYQLMKILNVLHETADAELIGSSVVCNFSTRHSLWTLLLFISATVCFQPQYEACQHANISIYTVQCVWYRILHPLTWIHEWILIDLANAYYVSSS